MAKFKDITGQRFGSVVAVEYVGRDPKTGRSQWRCICDCGNLNFFCISKSLIKGTTRSCGCQSSRNAIGNLNKRHGEANTPFYVRWRNIKSRCYNQNTPAYKNYGARGVELYSDWHTFENFRNYLLELYPNLYDLIEQGLHIDRIDNDGNYEPGNIHLVTQKANNSNRRNTHRIIFQGKETCLYIWLQERGITWSGANTTAKLRSGDISVLGLSPDEYSMETKGRYYHITKLSPDA